MDPSSSVNAPIPNKPAQEEESMVVDENLETPANPPVEPEEQQLGGKSGEVVAKMRTSLEKSRKPDSDVIKWLDYKQEAQMLELKLQMLHELIGGVEALNVLYDVKTAEFDENTEF